MSETAPDVPSTTPSPVPSPSRFDAFGGRALVILGLSGLAVAQPVFDLFGRNPEFFVAGSYSSSQIVLFALVVALVPPAVGIAAAGLATAIHPQAGRVTFAAVVALLSGVFALGVLRTIDLDRDVLAFAIAVAVGALAVVLVMRTRGGRLLAMYLSVANVLFVGLFLLASPTSALIVEDDHPDDLGAIDIPPVPGPVVLVVLDELPASTLLRADGTLNDDRYPNFARLAEVSTWFRNASSPHHVTHKAVPAILTGNKTKSGKLPTYQDAPNNLMSLLGTELPVHRYEVVSDMCPREVCAPPPRQPLSQALEDAAVVYGHRVLPADTRSSLPRIDQSWGQYSSDDPNDGQIVVDLEEDGSSWSGENAAARAYAKWRNMDRTERSAQSQAAILGERIDAITAAPAFHFIHVALPHGPWLLDRNLHASTSTPEPADDPDDPNFAFDTRQQYQLHATQVGAADTMVGRLLDHLTEVDALDDALVVVVSDHGTSLTPPDAGRNLTDTNREEVLRMAMFVKQPGQQEGELRDDSAQTIDVMPSIVDLLDISVTWEFEGHSLFDGSAAHTAPPVSTSVEPLLQIAEAHAAQFAGEDWVGLAGVGEHGDLVGQQVSTFDVGPPSTYRANVRPHADLSDLPTDDGELPLVVQGGVTAPDGDRERPPELLIAVNGRLAGVIGGYERDGTRWEFDAYVADFYRSGANELQVYEVGDGEAGGTVLHPVES